MSCASLNNQRVRLLFHEKNANLPQLTRVHEIKSRKPKRSRDLLDSCSQAAQRPTTRRGRVERRRHGYRSQVGTRCILSGNASVLPTIPGFRRALVEPCVPISSTRLSDWFHAEACDRTTRWAAARFTKP